MTRLNCVDLKKNVIKVKEANWLPKRNRQPRNDSLQITKKLKTLCWSMEGLHALEVVSLVKAAKTLQTLRIVTGWS